MGENIGACARAMKNCGLDDLRLVDPRDGWPNTAANAMAAHAEDIVEAAQVFDTLQQITFFVSTVISAHAVMRFHGVGDPSRTAAEAAALQ